MDIAEVNRILARAAVLARVENSSFEEEPETRKKLNGHGIPDGEIARQLETLQENSAGKTAVLTSYSLLHSLQHLDVIERKSARRSPAAEATIALFRCAEVCLGNLRVLAKRMAANLQAGRVTQAVSNARWRTGFEEVLYRLSALIVEVGADPADGSFLSIQDSPAHRGYASEREQLHQWLMSGWPEEDADIFAKDLDDPKRYVFFNEFVNSSDEQVWLSRLTRVRLPGVDREAGEEGAAFYERIVCSAEIEAMLEALETKTETDLLFFRAIHQIAEIIAGNVNQRLCEVIEPLLSPSGDGLDAAVKKMTVSNRLLAVVDDAIKLMMRALTPRAYKDVRPNLGMVRGTDSVMLRKRLFNATYPLLVRAFKLRISAFATAVIADDEAVHARARAVLARDDREALRLAELMQQIVVLHQHIRTWRDNHQQLPKQHLGVSPIPDRPTVSLSGSEGAVEAAHELRQIHAIDPVTPLYRALFGTTPPAVHELLTPGGFDEHMAHKTARAVFDVYADVQTRFYEREQKKGRAPSSSESEA